MSFATSSVLRALGGSVVAAERALTSSELPLAMAHAFLTSTRNALYSGVWMFASPTAGVSVLTR